MSSKLKVGLPRAPFVVRACPAVFAAILLGAAPAAAHDPFEITTDSHVAGDRMDVRTTMSIATAGRACLEGPAAPRRLEAADFPRFRDELATCAATFFRITAGGVDLPLQAVSVALTVEADVDMRLEVARPTRSPLVFDALRLRRLPPRAGVVLTATGARTFLGQQLLRPDDARLELPIGPDAEAPGAAPMPSFRQYLRLGVDHILGGVDHLLFLFGLLVVSRRLRTILGVVTCFTIAHSVTLALAALGVVDLSARIVEPLIAATIVFVGVENVLRGDEPRGRWALTFGFGLVHGLGFAGALHDLGLGAAGTSLLAPLVGFNLGVELGQLAVALTLLALFALLRRFALFARHGAKFSSLAIAAIGVVWLCKRLLA